jgi:hypothetical protein
VINPSSVALEIAISYRINFEDIYFPLLRCPSSHKQMSAKGLSERDQPSSRATTQGRRECFIN